MASSTGALYCLNHDAAVPTAKQCLVFAVAVAVMPKMSLWGGVPSGPSIPKLWSCKPWDFLDSFSSSQGRAFLPHDYCTYSLLPLLKTATNPASPFSYLIALYSINITDPVCACWGIRAAGGLMRVAHMLEKKKIRGLVAMKTNSSFVLGAMDRGSMKMKR